MFTTRVIFFSLIPLVFFGIPISGMLFPKEHISERWVRVPFLGMAGVILVAQNLVYADIPVGKSMPWIWITGMILWSIYLWDSHGSSLPLKDIGAQWSLLFVPIILIAIYIVQGFGIFGSSARFYMGRAWFDQYNYVSVAQFLADFPYSTPVINVTDQPYALTVVNPYISPGVSLIQDRIGQSVYHAFVFSSANVDARTTFESVILLFPIMVSVAVFWWTRSLFPARLALAAMFWAGVLPALTMLHLESFLSQALGIPFLIVFPFFLEDVCERTSFRSVVATAVILAAGVAIYTEFLPLFLAEILLFYVAWVVSRFSLSVLIKPENRREYNIKFLLPETENLQLIVHVFKHYILFLLIFVMVNIGFWNGALIIMERVDKSGLLTVIYPWAYTLEGQARLWFGDWSVSSPSAGLLFVAVGIFLTVFSYAGLLMNWLRRKRTVDLVLFILCALPLGLPVLGDGFEYQYYKMLLSVAPLFVVGIVYFMDGLNFSDFLNAIFCWRHWRISGGILFVIGLALTLFSAGSAWHMAYLSGFGRTPDELGRGGSFLLNSQETRDIEAFLRRISGEKILISYYDDFFDGAYINGWLAYFARNNHVYLTNPLISNLIVQEVFDRGVGVEPLSANGFIVTSSKSLCKGAVLGSSSSQLFRNKLYTVHRISGGEWFFWGQIAGSNKVEMNDAGIPFISIAKDPIYLVVYSGKAGLLTLDLMVQPGSVFSGNDVFFLEISTPDAVMTVDVDGDSRVQVMIPILQGKNAIQFQALRVPANEGESEMHLVELSNICSVSLR